MSGENVIVETGVSSFGVRRTAWFELFELEKDSMVVEEFNCEFNP